MNKLRQLFSLEVGVKSFLLLGTALTVGTRIWKNPSTFQCLQGAVDYFSPGNFSLFVPPLLPLAILTVTCPFGSLVGTMLLWAG